MFKNDKMVHKGHILLEAHFLTVTNLCTGETMRGYRARKIPGQMAKFLGCKRKREMMTITGDRKRKEITKI